MIDLIFVPPGFCFRISVLISRESQSLPEVKSQGLWFWSFWQISLSRPRFMDIREQMCPNKAFMSNTLPSKTTTSHKKENVQWIENLPERTLSTKKRCGQEKRPQSLTVATLASSSSSPSMSSSSSTSTSTKWVCGVNHEENSHRKKPNQVSQVQLTKVLSSQTI